MTQQEEIFMNNDTKDSIGNQKMIIDLNDSSSLNHMEHLFLKISSKNKLCNTPNLSMTESDKRQVNVSNVNNVINFNFNCDDFQDEKHKKIFFKFIYESLKRNKSFGKLTEMLSEEDIFQNVIDKNIPYHKYFNYILNYLRKSEPNIINKVK